MDNYQRQHYLDQLDHQLQLHHSQGQPLPQQQLQQQHQLQQLQQQLQQQQQQTIPRQQALMSGLSFFTLSLYKKRKDLARSSVIQEYEILGYIAAGTYGKVYKAKYKQPQLPGTPLKLFAIKKFKSDNEVSHYTGISQSAIREMSLCRELQNENIVQLSKIILELKCIYMVSEFAEHDLLQIIHYHSHPSVRPIPEQTLKSIMYQTLNGVNFLHQNWVLHRDLKPANIMVNSNGVVKVGDLGLARKFNNLLQSLYTGDKVVVTIWYRAPELLLGSRHYTPLIDNWAVGCILLELLSLRPIFKGEELKIDNRKQVPFQENQMLKILEILGTPVVQEWPNLPQYPEYHNLSRFATFPSTLSAWYHSIGGTNKQCLKLLSQLLEYDPQKRLQLFQSLNHQWFQESPFVTRNIFENSKFVYPDRKIQKDDNDILSSGIGGNNSGNGKNNGTKRSYNGLDANIRKKMMR